MLMHCLCLVCWSLAHCMVGLHGNRQRKATHVQNQCCTPPACDTMLLLVGVQTAASQLARASCTPMATCQMRSCCRPMGLYRNWGNPTRTTMPSCPLAHWWKQCRLCQKRLWRWAGGGTCHMFALGSCLVGGVWTGGGGGCDGVRPLGQRDIPWLAHQAQCAYHAWLTCAAAVHAHCISHTVYCATTGSMTNVANTCLVCCPCS